MAPLVNHKHEKFARLIAEGIGRPDAYEQAGYRRDNGNAQNMATKPHIVARVAELRGQVADRLMIDRSRVLEEVARIAFHNVADYVTVNEDDTVSIDLSAINRDHAAAIQELTAVSHYDKHGTRTTEIKLKLAPKLPALDSLGKHLGLWVTRHEVGKPGDFANLASASEVLEHVRALLGDEDARALQAIVQGNKPDAIEAELIERQGSGNVSDTDISADT